jgi:hypothetical protein
VKQRSAARVALDELANGKAGAEASAEVAPT